MITRSNRQDKTRTPYVQLDTGKCKACWKCLDECKNHVIGKINLPWHKHSLFVNIIRCTGCLQCVKICEPGALTKCSIKEPGNNATLNKLKLAFVINLGLLVFGFAMSFSGFIIQLVYHMGHTAAGLTYNSVLGPGYNNWTNIHKVSIIIVSFLATYHFILHWKWYKQVLTKKLAAKNKQQIILTIVFVSVAITGYIPWILDLSAGPEILRKFLIEIHDKIAILLFVLLAIHMTNRLKWYITSLNRLKSKQSTSRVHLPGSTHI